MNEKELRAGHVRVWDDLIQNADNTRQGLETLAKAGVRMPNEAGADTVPARIAAAIDAAEEYRKHRALAQQRLDSVE